MEIKSSITNKAGQVYQIIYNDIDDIKEAEGKNVIGIYAYCFYNDKLVIVNENGYTGNPGGGLEKDENIIEGLHREVLEETNMKILQYKPVGIHETIRPGGESVFYIRFACLVEPVGDFKKDPAGDVVGISFVDPSEFLQLCDLGWGEVALRMLERAVEFKIQNMIMTHKMKLQLTPFEKIKNGKKTIEVRLNDEKRQLIKVNDEIEFTLNNADENIRVKVTELLLFKNFKDLYYSINPTETGDLDRDDFKEMYKYYSKEDEEKYGVLGIRFILI